MGRLDSVYANLPVWTQNLAVSSYGLYWRWLRFGPGYKQDLQNYQHRENFSPEEWKVWQEKQISRLLEVAANQVPYYSQTWSASEKHAALAGKLGDLPFLEKDPLRADPKQFLRKGVNEKQLLLFHTSGSTGTPIATYWTRRELRSTTALREARSTGWAGVSFNLPRATFSGRLVEPNPMSHGPFYRFNRVEKQVYFSAFHLRPDTAAEYVQALQRHHVQWLTGYAVSLFILATYILEQKLEIPPLKAVITTSEKLTPEMRAVMQRAFACRVFEEYSTVENVLFAHDCEKRRLHVSPDAGVIEILRPDGSPCEPGETGEVVATGLIRTVQPLIRFRLGDLAAWSPEPCPCGRGMPVIQEVFGRMEDMVTGPDGRKMVRFHGIFIGLPCIREGQIVQEALDHIHVKVVPASGLTLEDHAEITRRVQQRLGLGVSVTVETVAAIPRTASGKFPAVVSKLKPKTDGKENQ